MEPAPKVYAAINAVAAALSVDGISKARKNEQQNYKFRGIDDVYNAVSSFLAQNKLCILPRMTERNQVERVTAKGGALFYTTVRAEFDFVSVEDGSKHTVVTFGEAMDTADKSTNKAMSAAYKYALMQTFAIPTEGDNDADSTTHEVRGRQESKAGGQPARTPEGAKPAEASPHAADDRPATNGHPLRIQLEQLLGKYGEKRGTNEVRVAQALGVESLAKLPDARLPEAIVAVQKHQKAVKEAKAAAAKAAKAPAQQPDDARGQDSEIPV